MGSQGTALRKPHIGYQLIINLITYYLKIELIYIIIQNNININMGTTISKNTTTRITEFKPFIFCEDDKYYDYRLECYITFNKPAKDINIKKL